MARCVAAFRAGIEHDQALRGLDGACAVVALRQVLGHALQCAHQQPLVLGAMRGQPLGKRVGIDLETIEA